MRLPVLTTLLLLLFPSVVVAESAESPEAAVARMLSAVGGREAWASLKGTVNDSQQNRMEEPRVVRAVITMDFRRPRFRIDTTAPGIHVVRVIDGDRSWRRRRDGSVEDLPADLYAEDMEWYGAHIYRTIHRIAARDAALSFRFHADGRLEVMEAGRRLIWLKLDPAGEPYAFGQRDDETGSLFGPWDFQHGGIKQPIWVARPDGSWRANVLGLALNPDMEAVLRRPQS